MARNESIHGLYMRLGLDFSELDQNFVQATRTLKSNMASLSRENTIIRLQTEVDLTGIEDADQRLAVQTESLNRQLEIQRSRLRLATASLTDMSRRTGESSDETQRARITVERERLALRRLERELRNLNETQDETNAGTHNLIESLGSIAGRFAPAIAGLVAFKEGVSAVSEVTTELIENFRELQKQSYELNMPIAKTNDFLRTLRLGGGDIGDFEGYIRGITDAYVKGDVDDPEFIALSKYGAKITDVTGRLKDFKDITEEVYQAWKKADAAGEGIEFLQLTGGEMGVRDTIQFFKRYEEAKADAERIFKVNVDYESLHTADREFNILSEQVGELKNALGNLVMPVAGDIADTLSGWLKSATEAVTGFSDSLQEDMEGNTKSWADFRKEVEEPVNVDNNPLSQYAVQRIKDFHNQIEDLQAELDNWGDDLGQAHAANELWLQRELTNKLHVSEKERQAIRELYAVKEAKIDKQRADEAIKQQEEAANRIREITQEAASIEYGMKHSAFEKQLYDIERWKEAQTEKADTAEEVAAIIKNAASKEAEAYEREVERIKGATQSLEDEIFEMENSQYEADKRRAMQKAQKALDEGIDPAVVQRYLDDKLGQLAEKASKGGDYVKSPGDKPGAKYIDFDKPTQPSIGLFTDSGKIMERLKTSTEQVKDVQTLLKQSMESNIEVLKGTEGALNDFRKGLEPTEVSSPQVIGQNVLSSKELQSLVAALARTQLVKDSYGNYSTKSGRGAELYTFIHSLENMGAQWQQVSAFLDRLIAVHGQPQQVQQSKSVNNTNNYYNTFNVDGGDDDSVEKIANEIANILERNTQNGRSYAT